MSGTDPHSFTYAHIVPTDTERLFRRCKKSHLVPQTGEIGFWLFSNATADGMMSADAERCRSEAQEVALVQPTGWGVVAISAKACFELEQVLLFWPEEDNPAHTQVAGVKTTGTKKKLAASATLLLQPAMD